MLTKFCPILLQSLEGLLLLPYKPLPALGVTASDVHFITAGAKGWVLQCLVKKNKLYFSIHVYRSMFFLKHITKRKY